MRNYWFFEKIEMAENNTTQKGYTAFGQNWKKEGEEIGNYRALANFSAIWRILVTPFEEAAFFDLFESVKTRRYGIGVT